MTSTFKPLLTTDKLVRNTTATSNTFTNVNSSGSISVFPTSSLQISGSSGYFFYNVYASASMTSSANIQFSIAYGHRNGSGSTLFSDATGFTPSRSIYGQYRNLVYGDENRNFTFGLTDSKDIIVINVARSRYREHLEVGGWSLRLKNYVSSSIPGQDIYLTDDSNLTTSAVQLTNIGRMYNIVSGALGFPYNSSSVQTNSGSYGFFFPDAGIYILNPRALSLSSSLGGIDLVVPTSGIDTGSAPLNNFCRVFFTGSLTQRSEETVSDQFYFVRLQNNEFNFTTNTSATDTNGNINYQSLIENPTTFVTTVGLYNNNGDLLAVAKPNKPLTKDFTKEQVIRVKLSY
jgi:hypothetical protein